METAFEALKEGRRLQEQVLEQMCGVVAPESAAKLRESADRHMFPSAWAQERDAERIAVEVVLGLPPGDAKGIAVAEAHRLYRDGAKSARKDAIRLARDARGLSGFSRQGASTLADATRTVQEGDLEFYSTQLFGVFVERVAAAVTKEAIRPMARVRGRIDAHYGEWGYP
ncbi:MAG: hypothetical protein JNK53_06570 [Phycisphaerae bacterium]|nr:hypothetical protein [Phycisphaerae bacterium]